MLTIERSLDAGTSRAGTDRAGSDPQECPHTIGETGLVIDIAPGGPPIGGKAQKPWQGARLSNPDHVLVLPLKYVRAVPPFATPRATWFAYSPLLLPAKAREFSERNFLTSSF